MLQVAYKNNYRSERATISPIVNVLSYFSLFNYPLLPTEIEKFLPPGVEYEDIRLELDNLEALGYINRIGEFYSILADTSLAERRRLGNERAQILLRKAGKIGRFLSCFPFVKGVAISGSLSKNYADERSDIDFFIITRANRLWIARTMMHLFKKFTFILGKQHLYCMNYYVDEMALRIPEQNMYTAIETVTLMPVQGEGVAKFFQANSWTGDWFASRPNRESRIDRTRKPLFSRILECVLDSNLLDNLFLRLTRSRWKRKMERGMKNMDGRKMNLELGKHFARSNPGCFQEQVLSSYEVLVEATMEKFENWRI